MLKRMYAEISKVEPQEDGTLKVFGYASSGAEDSDGESITPDAMKAALPDYLKFGAVREMHQASVAAGTAIEATVEESGKTYFGAHVVDPVAVKKVQTKVYKGFSIGGKVTKRDDDDKKKIIGLKLVEISLVDRPANPDAVFTCYKAEGDDKPSEPEAKPEVDDKKVAVEELATLINKGDLSPREIVTLATSEIARKAAPPPEKKKLVPAEVKKGMYGVQQFASLLQSLAWLTQDTAAEAEWEADASTLPQSLKDWLSAGVLLFNAMSMEVSAELIASLTSKTAAETVGEMAKSGKASAVEIAKALGFDERTAWADIIAKAESLTKAGAKFSTKTKAVLGQVHKAMQDACEHMAKLGYDKADDDESDKAATIDPAVAPLVIVEPVQKVDQLGDIFKTALAERDATIDDLKKRIKVIEDQPLPPKGALLAIAKGDDVIATEKSNGVTPIKKHDGQIDEAATLIKAAHANGGMTLFNR